MKDLTKFVQNNNNIYKIVIDLKNLKFIDSPGIGMLLILNEVMFQRNGTIELINPHDQVARIIRIINLEDILKHLKNR